MRARFHTLALIPALLGAMSCSTAPETVAPESPASAPTALDTGLPVILAFGDSLTNGYEVEDAMSYPSQLQDRLDALGYRYRVVNHGNDGDTTAQGVARLPDALALEPAIVILEFGGNDGLQGRSLDAARDNLAVMIEAFQAIDSRVILAGLTLPRNYGPDYIAAFENMYVELAERHDVDRIPFFLEGLVDLEALDAGEATLEDSLRYMQPDGTHPTAEGYTIVADTVFNAIEGYLNAPGP